MDAITELIKNLINKEIRKSTLISSVPCRVIESLGNEMYTVQLVTDNSRYTLPNMSGSSLSVGENVQLFYYGEYISSKSSYIGASLNKSNDTVYINGEDTFNVSLNNRILVSEIIFNSERETTINVVFNSVIGSNKLGDYTFETFVDDNKQSFDCIGTVTENGYSNCNFVIPVEISEAGVHRIQIYGEGVGSIAQMKTYIFGQYIYEYVIPSEPTNEDDYIYYLGDNYSETIRYISSYENIIMPTTLEGKPLTKVGMTTFNYGDVQGVIIPEGITTIE